MLTNPDNKHREVDSKHREVDVVEQFLKGVGHNSTAAGHDLHHGTQTDIVIYDNDHGMTRLLGDNAVREFDEDGAKTYDQTDNEK
jgi:hypothetical protein